MGALTDKNSTFELRGWEVNKLTSFDLTNSFSYTLKLVISTNKVLAIEPSYSNNFLNHVFINNKSRYFFDTLQYSSTNTSFNFMLQIVKALSIILYIFDLNILKNGVINFFYIYYGNISTDLLCLLSLFRQKYEFIRLKNIVVKKLINNLESNFLVNNIKLDKSNCCLLINVNVKIEATGLGLVLKQRSLKGNFRLLGICSFFNLIANLKTIGTSLKLIILISKGVHPLCQTLKHEQNLCLLLNSQLLELNNSKFIIILLLYLSKYFNCYKFNTLNRSIYEPAVYLVNNLPINNKILFNFSSIYLLNLLDIQHHFVTNLLDLNLLYLKIQSYLLKIKTVCLIQCNFPYSKYRSYSNYMKNTNCFNLVTKAFYQDSALFFNTEGLMKKSFKLFNNQNLVSSWKILRIILNYFNNKLSSVSHNYGYNLLIHYSLKLKLIFLKFIHLLILAKKPINNIDIINNISPFSSNNLQTMCYLKMKLTSLRLKFWISDFYISGTDGLTNNSITMLKYSKTLRLQLTNFF